MLWGKEGLFHVSKKPILFPRKEDVQSYLSKHAERPSKKAIYDHFKIKGGPKKIRMKALLKEIDAQDDPPSSKAPKKNTAPDPSALQIEQFVVGRVTEREGSYWLIPTTKKIKTFFKIAEEKHLKAADIGTVYRAEILSLEPPKVSLVESLGSLDKISFISAQTAGLPLTFPEEVIAASQGLKVPPLEGREDIRDIPLVTIDGADSKDFDDAVWAAPDPHHPGGWHIIVAIADVSHYVQHAKPIDAEALNRGTSTYFPDMVVPMLPEALSNDLCSLRPHEDRACVGVHLYIDRHGQKKKHTFFRGLMRSAARLTYEQIQRYYEQKSSEAVPFSFVEHLYGAFKALNQHRESRGTLDVDMEEPRIIVGKDGTVEEITIKPRLDSHRLIEEFMVLANVAAAEFLETHKTSTLYRVHEKPDVEKVQELKRTLKTLKINWTGPLAAPGDFTKLLRFVEPTPYKKIINEMVLRCQSQAVYTPQNKGHFGLNLTHYSHFTSPIRRYPDLLVHRGIVGILGYSDGLSDAEKEDMTFLGNDTSTKERRAEGAERDATDRFMTQYLSERINEKFSVYVSGVNKAGLFVSIIGVGASGLIPMNQLGQDYYIFKENPSRLEGRRTRHRFFLGDRLTVKLIEADQVKGRLTFSLEEKSAKVVRPNAKPRRRHRPKK